MASKVALGLVIGGAVDSSLGAAFKNVNGEIQKLQARSSRAKVLQRTIGETIRLRDEWKKAHESGAASADTLLKKLEANNNSLRRQGIEVGRLTQEYRSLGNVVRSAEFKAKGMGQIQAGKEGLQGSIGTAVAGTAMVAVPTKVSADFQAIVRDITIKSGTANTQQEVKTSQDIIQTSKDTGMANTQVADLVNQLVGGGMELTEALKYAPLAAKFAVGQGAAGTDTAKMILAMQNNAKITDPKLMEQALASVAYMGQEGSFEAADMAKWFPELLAQMASTGITGQDAVTQLGAMLQVQIKSAGSADAAANNLKNWISKIGSGETVKGYADVGIDYQGSMDAAIAKGKSTFEASFDLAKAYVQKTDPNKAAKLEAGMAKISQETDPAKAQAMSEALAETLRTGDLFADMQVKTALMAYTQNKKVYDDLKKNAADPDGKSKGMLDKNLAERRETSSQRWAEAGQAVNDSMRAMGDALRPVTDQLATGIGAAARGLAALADSSPLVVTALAAVTAGAFVLAKAWAAIKIGRGLANIARGSVGNNSNIVQRVFVTNSDDVGGGLDEGKGRGADGKGKGPGSPRSVGAVVSKGVTVAKGLGPLALVGAGLQVADTYQNAKTPDEKAEGYGGAVGGLVGGVAGGALAGAAVGSVVPVIGTAIGGIIGGMLGAWGGGELGATVSKKLFGGPDKPDGAAVPAIGDAMKAPTAEQRQLSAQEAAAIMAKVPAIAPLAGGQDIGNVVRSMATTPATPVTAAALMPDLAAVKKPEVPKVDQVLTFSPTSTFTIQGDVKDPAQLVNELAPHLRRMFDDFAREAKSKQLFDAPHVG